MKERLKTSNPKEFEEWSSKHVCKLNHVGSAGAMEVDGGKLIFGRSIEKHGLRFTKYLGDGDIKSFTSIKSIYPGVDVEKLECVGHIQKRAGTRLRNMKKNVRNLGGGGANSQIKQSTDYKIIIVPENVGNLDGMKIGIHASLFHVASSKNNTWHDHCPPDENSWCRHQSDRITGLSTYKPGPGLPLDVIKNVKPIYAELSSDNLLSKCLHGKTQKQNEIFNALIWERLPKSTYVSMTQLKFGSYDAVAHFNIGEKKHCFNI